MPDCVVVVLGTRASLLAVPAVTVRLAVALVRPGALTATVALPIVVGVRLEVATPALAAIGDAGLNEPDTPLTEKVIGLVAVSIVCPLAS